jgi:carbonic anhydrase
MEATMSIIDKALKANRNYAKKYNPTLGKRPAPKIAVVTCMDPRLSGILGLRHADLDDASPAPMRFFSYKDPEENTREQIKKVRSHPWISKDVPVRGFVFDVDTGLLQEVRPLAHHTTA